MGIILDFSALPHFDNPIQVTWWLFLNGGWIIPAALYFIAAPVLFWIAYVRGQYRRKRKYILLAIDIPKNNEQTPLAVEHIFSHLAGAHQQPGKFDRWWGGEINDSFSLEIISIGGYIQFIIHTLAKFRDLVEATIYAQYPDAEITEVEDYTKRWNIKFPNDQYNLFSMEIKLAKDDIFPIITYKNFEDSISQEIKDPMASLLEAMSRIGPGEEIWVQYVITPANNDWGDKAKTKLRKMVGKPAESKKDIIQKTFELSNYLVDSVISAPAATKTEKKAEHPSLVQYLTPGEKDVVAAVEHKITKIGFHTKIRYIYLAEKTKFVKERGIQGLFGSFKQFSDLGLNAFKPDKKKTTGGVVLFKKQRIIDRQNKCLYRYKSRGHWLEPGYYGFILNTEELATLWHFPIMTVKTPAVKKAESKRSEPPMSLPIERSERPTLIIDRGGKVKAEPPPTLPIQ